MGYGSRALQLIQDYYQSKIADITEDSDEVPQEARNTVEEVTYIPVQPK